MLQQPQITATTTNAKGGATTNSAAKFGQLDSNNFTLGATNINVFTLSPRAFSSSMLSSLSKELLSNLSSGQKNKPFLFSFQGSQTKLDSLQQQQLNPQQPQQQVLQPQQQLPQQPQQYLVDPQGQNLHQIYKNPIMKKNSAVVYSHLQQNNPHHQTNPAEPQSKKQSRTPQQKHNGKYISHGAPDRPAAIKVQSSTATAALLNQSISASKDKKSPTTTILVQQHHKQHKDHKQQTQNYELGQEQHIKQQTQLQFTDDYRQEQMGNSIDSNQNKEKLPRNVSQRQINDENLLVLPLQIQKRRQLQKNETQTSKKSLCLQETFPEGLITLNKEILDKRLSSGGFNSNPQIMMNSGQAGGLKSARQSYRSLITTDEALKGGSGQQITILDSQTNNYFKNHNTIDIEIGDEDEIYPKIFSKNMMPPKAPQTTRNVLKVNNFISNGKDSEDIVNANNNNTGKPIKFNFKIPNSKKQQQQQPMAELEISQQEQQSLQHIHKKRLAKSRQITQPKTATNRQTASMRQQRIQPNRDFVKQTPAISLYSPAGTSSSFMNNNNVGSNKIEQVSTTTANTGELINNSALTVLQQPQSTTNQSSSKLTYRKFQPITIESDSDAKLKRHHKKQFLITPSSSAITPRNLTIIPKSAFQRRNGGGGKLRDQKTTDETQNQVTMTTLSNIFSPSAIADDSQSLQASREKVVKQLIAKLTKSQSLQQQQQTQQQSQKQRRNNQAIISQQASGSLRTPQSSSMPSKSTTSQQNKKKSSKTINNNVITKH